MPLAPLEKLAREIIRCRDCPRLRRYGEAVASEKRRAYLHEAYWGRPVPGFGDSQARLFITGLAPAAHGANRTGRIFTGDRSGEWLYRALHQAGFANQADSSHRDDGLLLRDAYISCVVRCAPPDNKPRPDELNRCSENYLRPELALFPQARVYLALGQIALQGLWPLLAEELGLPLRPRPRFGHGLEYELRPGKWLLLSYHPSQQNTFTGRLTEPMFEAVFAKARVRIGGG